MDPLGVKSLELSVISSWSVGYRCRNRNQQGVNDSTLPVWPFFFSRHQIYHKTDDVAQRSSAEAGNLAALDDMPLLKRCLIGSYPCRGLLAAQTNFLSSVPPYERRPSLSLALLGSLAEWRQKLGLWQHHEALP